jgi:hypothetical protein
MLNNLSEQIRECLQHAEECARKAGELPDGSAFRQDFVRLEKRGLNWRGVLSSAKAWTSLQKISPSPVYQGEHKQSS